VLLTVIAFMVEPSADAALNCGATGNCIEVAASGFSGPGDPCWLDSYSYTLRAFTGKSYGTTFAAVGWGQNSVGGNPGTATTTGSWSYCNGATNDCSAPPDTNKLPLSGTVSQYVGTVKTDQAYNTKCSGTGE
jgi:hypothetical protein